MEEVIEYIKDLGISVGATSLTDEDYEKIFDEMPEEIKECYYDLVFD